MNEPTELTPGRSIWLSAMIGCSFAVVGLLGLIYFREGTLSMQKSMVYLVMPIGLAWLASFTLMVGWWMGRSYRLATGSLLVFVMISVLFNGWFINFAFAKLEGEIPKPSPTDVPVNHFRAVVVLGGGAGIARNDEPEVNIEGERVISAAQLWLAGKTQAIVCTGDNYRVANVPSLTAAERDRRNLSHCGVELLMSLGVPKESLFRIGGVNTIGEMQNLKAMFQSPPSGMPSEGAVGLITSAYHMRRAMRLAESVGLKVEPIPVAYHTTLDEPFLFSDAIPTASAGAQFNELARELLGRMIGR